MRTRQATLNGRPAGTPPLGASIKKQKHEEIFIGHINITNYFILLPE